VAHQPGWAFLGSAARTRCHAALSFSPDQEEQESEQKWRTVGTIRRYILLLLTLAQTVVATWYMKTILPYQGWALINPADMVGQNLWISFMQLLPYMLQTGILILFAVLFCWVSAGFWTALMGFLQLLMGRDKYSIPRQPSAMNR
jgi:membrane glycosyltransferase